MHDLLPLVKDFGFPAFLLVLVLWRIDKYATEIVLNINSKIDKGQTADHELWRLLLDHSRKIAILEGRTKDCMTRLNLTSRSDDPRDYKKDESMR